MTSLVLLVHVVIFMTHSCCHAEQELGSCDYETGDDGMMLTTVLDRRVASYEFLPVSDCDAGFETKTIAIIRSPYHRPQFTLLRADCLVTSFPFSQC